MLFALGDNADEIALDHHGTNARNAVKRSPIDQLQAPANEFAAVDTHIRWTHHATMQHAGHAHVVHIDELAGDLGRNVDAADRLADDVMLIDWLERGVGRKRQKDAAVAEQRVERNRRGRVAVPADAAVSDGQVRCNALQRLGGEHEQILSRLRGSDPQGLGRDLNSFAGNGRSLIRGF